MLFLFFFSDFPKSFYFFSMHFSATRKDFFWIPPIKGTSMVPKFFAYRVNPGSTGPFTVPKNMPFFIDFDSCLHALYEWY